MTLPEDITKIRDELAEEHKLLTKDNGIESSNYHFKAGFNACAEIFLKRERDNQKVFFDEIQWMELNKLQANNESLRQYGLEQFRLAQKLQAQLLVAKDTLDKIRSGLTTDQTKVEFYTKKLAHETLVEIEALAATAQAPKEK